MTKRSTIFSLVGAWLLPLFLLASSAEAQRPIGTIEGVVTDTSGGVLPGVQVVANSPALIQKDFTVYTNAQGYYRVPSVPPGTYSLQFILQGFQSVKREGLILASGQTLTIDVQLGIGGIEETVTVTGESPVVDVRSAKLGFNYTEELVENVPTLRDFHEVVSTIPGVESARPYGVAPGNLKKENVLGAGSFANRYTMDGGNVTDPTISHNQAALFSYDIIEEVQVLKGGKPAEVGFSQGGYFNTVTKSGGNDLSGVVGLYYQGEGTQSETSGIADPNQIVDDYDFTATGGGKIVQDKLWWFGSYRKQDRTFKVLGFPDNISDEITGIFWKNTWQASPNHRIDGKYNRWDQSVDIFFFGFSPRFAAGPEVSMDRNPGGDTAQFNWTGIFGSNVTATASFGWNDFRLHQFFQENATVASRDLVTQMRFGNAGNGGRDSVGSNWDYAGTVSWFVPDAAGRHDFKFGAEYTYSPFDWGFTQIEDHQLRLANGAPEQVQIWNTPVNAKWLQTYFSLFAQDDWTIQDKLTLNVGVRYDRIFANTPEQTSGGGEFAGTALAAQFPELELNTIPEEDLWTWNSIAPRFAASYDVAGDGKSVVKGSFSRYYHHLSAQQVWSVNQNFPRVIGFTWDDPNGDGSYQIGEEGTLLFRSGGGTVFADPDVKHPHSDEFTVGYSQEVLPDFFLGATYVWRRDENLTNRVEVGIPWDPDDPTALGSYTAVDVNDPEGGTLTVFAQNPETFGNNRQLFTNPDRFGFDNTRTYNGVEIVANKRLRDNWQIVGSVNIGDMDVIMPVDSGGGALGREFLNPNNFLNKRGRDPLNEKFLLKVQGTYQAPYGVNISGLWRAGSGLPFTRELVVSGLPQGTFVVFAEPRGTLETESYNWVDLRVEKEFALADRTRLGLIVDFFNLTNADTVRQVGTRTAINLGVPLNTRFPRIVRFGARLMW